MAKQSREKINIHFLGLGSFATYFFRLRLLLLSVLWNVPEIHFRTFGTKYANRDPERNPAENVNTLLEAFPIMTPFALQYRLLKIFFTAHPALFPDFPFLFLGWLVLILSLTKEQKKNTKFWKFYHVLLTVTSFLSRITQENGNRSSRPRVISPLVMSPETWVMLPEILVMSAEKKIKSPEETNTKQIRISDFK